MRTLYLLRHAKSCWKDPAQADFERPLAGRGRKACEMVARLIQAREISFDLVLCSTAIRARQTIELVNQHAKLRTEMGFDERIYEATATLLVDSLAKVENDRKSVLLVGHNPGFADLVSWFTGTDHSFPTACLAKIKFKISKWSDCCERDGSLDWITSPKQWEESQ